MKGTAVYRNHSQIDALRHLSVRIGSDSLLVQAGNGNTSLKQNGVLWIKASGKWLSSAATENIFIPLDLDAARLCVQRNTNPSALLAVAVHHDLCPSIETAMHAVLPHPVVAHVHSVNTIAFAVRRDGKQQLSQRLGGLRWTWIPYTSSGLPLAREVQKAMLTVPEANILVLANHGLVVCGDDCDSVLSLLDEVERRVAIVPRTTPSTGQANLTEVAAVLGWHAPSDPMMHTLGADEISRTHLSRGVLYPCQAMFLGEKLGTWEASCQRLSEEDVRQNERFLILSGMGLIVSSRLTDTEHATLSGLAQVLMRLPADAPIKYLNKQQVSRLFADQAPLYSKYTQSREAIPVAAS